MVRESCCGAQLQNKLYIDKTCMNVPISVYEHTHATNKSNRCVVGGDRLEREWERMRVRAGFFIYGWDRPDKSHTYTFKKKNRWTAHYEVQKHPLLITYKYIFYISQILYKSMHNNKIYIYGSFVNTNNYTLREVITKTNNNSPRNKTNNNNKNPNPSTRENSWEERRRRHILRAIMKCFFLLYISI